MASEFSRDTRNRLFAPLSWAAYITWAAITFSAVSAAALSRGDVGVWLGFGALLGMLGLFVLPASNLLNVCRHPRWMTALVVLQGLLVLAAQQVLGHGGVSALLIIVAAQLFTMLPIAAASAILVVLNLGLLAYWASRGNDLRNVVLNLIPMMGFQAFAALTALYAERSERRGDELADLNAELRATQRLLEESTRSDERLRLSRELHDVAGHKLTALKLHLRALHRDPTFAAREELGISLQLADELLSDIRAVVGELRQHDGIDLGEALQALARPLPGVRIELQGRELARVATVAQAEALLRVAQEGLTNALRHSQATRITLRVETIECQLRLSVEDDGRGRLPLAEGNGLRGMRERLAAFGGALSIEERKPQGLAVHAELPAGAAA